ncbi:hypothetical protein [Persephonella hydrogeniphila]|nr:hypothetical protein [Persephonella hydrogeniphila]
MLPTPEHIKDNLYKIYFSGRNKENRSYIGFAVIELNNDKITVLEYSKEPVLKPGDLGCFDDSGVTPACILKTENVTYLYYIGWRPRSSVRMELMPGLAVKESEYLFKRIKKVPILSRNDNEPISILTAPFVMKEGEQFRMWYVSGIRWINPDLPQYDIKYAESKDGVNWFQTGKVAIPLEKDENALARPFVWKDGKYKMLFSYKKTGENYQIGYAESDDGVRWKRINNHHYSPPRSNWDAEMQAYSVIIKNKYFEFMLYNGNSYGKEGIGYAVRERKEYT